MTAQGRVVGVILASTSAWAACLCTYVATGDHRWIGGSFAAWFGGVVLTLITLSYNAWSADYDDEHCDEGCEACARDELADQFTVLDEYPPTAQIGERARERDWLADVSNHERQVWLAIRRELDGGGDDAGVRA